MEKVLVVFTIHKTGKSVPVTSDVIGNTGEAVVIDTNARKGFYRFW